VLTLLVLVCTEIIPKTLGTVYARFLVGFVGQTIGALTWALAPFLYVTRILTRLIAPGGVPPISRTELAALVGMAAREGAIHLQESQLFENVLELEQIKVEDVMTPRTVVIMLPATYTLGQLVEQTETSSVSRIPLFGDDRDRVVGYCVQREALLAAARGADPATPLSEFKREVMFIPENATLARALRAFLEQGEHLAVTIDEFGGVSGLVTLEDLMETLLGVEIVDESDRVADLRHLATELRDRRLARRQARRASDPAPRAPG
jgi:CBS domain containing-hemolysin-like protein